MTPLSLHIILLLAIVRQFNAQSLHPSLPQGDDDTTTVFSTISASEEDEQILFERAATKFQQIADHFDTKVDTTSKADTKVVPAETEGEVPGGRRSLRGLQNNADDDDDDEDDDEKFQIDDGNLVPCKWTTKKADKVAFRCRTPLLEGSKTLADVCPNECGAEAEELSSVSEEEGVQQDEQDEQEEEQDVDKDWFQNDATIEEVEDENDAADIVKVEEIVDVIATSDDEKEADNAASPTGPSATTGVLDVPKAIQSEQPEPETQVAQESESSANMKAEENDSSAKTQQQPSSVNRDTGRPGIPKPNVVLIVVDDIGYADVGFTQTFFGQSSQDRLAEVLTPNIDAAAQSGVMFTDGYSSGEICAPTRAGLMLGRYQQGVGNYAGDGKGLGMPVLEYNANKGTYSSINPWMPEFMQYNDTYVTGSFGKWHLGIDRVLIANGDGTIKEQTSQTITTTPYQRGDPGWAIPRAGPLLKSNEETSIGDGLPSIYERIADPDQAGSPYHPLYRGFDANNIFMGKGQQSYWDPNGWYVSMDTNKPSLAKVRSKENRRNPGNNKYSNSDNEPTEVWDKESNSYRIHKGRIPEHYATNNITRSTVEFIKEHAKGDKPFFAYVPYNAPHAPAHAPYHFNPNTGELDRLGENRRRYAGLSKEAFASSNMEEKWFRPNFDDDEWFPDPLFLYEQYKGDGFKDYLGCCNDESVRRRAIVTAMNRWVDKGVGQIVAALEDQGVLEDTLIFFISDNGGAGEMHASNKPLTGQKQEVTEGGHRVPFFVRWDRFMSNVDGKGTDVRGTTNSAPVMSTDILPTILDAAGLDDTSQHRLLRNNPTDGKSMLPLMDGSASNIHKYLFWAREKGSGYEGAVRRDDWKLLLAGGGKLMLHDLARDLEEKNDISSDHPEIVEELKEAFMDWMDEMAKRNGEKVPNVRLKNMI